MISISIYEAFSLVMSGIALLVAISSKRSANKIALQQLELAQVHATLSAKQLEQFEERDKALGKAAIDLTIEDAPEKNTYYVVINNLGMGEARDVNFICEGDASIAENEIRDKIPIQSLREGKQVRLMALKTYDTAPVFTATVSWKNPDGSIGNDSFQLFT